MGVSIERELNDLDRGITTLKVEYGRYFGGELKRPPVQARRAIEETLRRLGNSDVDKAAERFRLQTIQSRYNSLVELWEKRMQAKEEGRTGVARRPVPVAPHAPDASGGAPKEGRKTPPPLAAAELARLLAEAEAAVARKAPAPAPDAPAPSSVKPRSRVDFTPLFQRYVAARQALGEDVSKLRYERFEEAVRKQADEIRRQTGSSRLVFEVQTTEGRVRLVGRPAAPGPKG